MSEAIRGNGKPSDERARFTGHGDDRLQALADRGPGPCGGLQGPLLLSSSLGLRKSFYAIKGK